MAGERTTAITARISEKVFLIDTLALGQSGTVAAYLLRGSKIALVDCGYASSHETVLSGLKELGIQPEDVDYLIPTHVHLDHAGAAGHLLRSMPKATVFAQERGIPHLVDPTRLIESATSVFGEELIRLYGKPVGIPQKRITPIGEEIELDLAGDLTVTAVHTPGHAPHQVSVLVRQGRERLLLTADAVGIVYPALPTMIPTTPPPSLDPLKLAESIRRLEAMHAKLLLIPHFGMREDVEWVLRETIDKTEAWVLKGREMKSRGASFDEIVLEFTNWIARDAGIPIEAFSPFAALSIRTSVMGILHYLERTPR